MNYFAYGSNINFEHMRRICGWHFSVLGPAVLEDFAFGSDSRGYANITHKKGAHVWGVLYDLDQEALDTLDKFEGYPNVFQRIEVKVQDEKGYNHKAWVYTEGDEQTGGKQIRLEYLKRTLAGAADNKLPDDWIDYLKSFGENQ